MRPAGATVGLDMSCAKVRHRNSRLCDATAAISQCEVDEDVRRSWAYSTPTVDRYLRPVQRQEDQFFEET